MKNGVRLSMIRSESKPFPDYVQRRRGQDRQCSYNLTLRRVRATTVTVEEKSIVRMLSVCL
jgi:hypothetical protein